MMVMTAKINYKKIAVILIAAAVAVAGLLMLFGGDKTRETAAAPIANNDARIHFLKGFGWDVTTSPVESTQVRIPENTSEVYDRYNRLQKSQGYDLSAFAGKNVMRYVYEVKNYPGAREPVYATMLVYKNQVIGGDITDTAAKGQIRGFALPKADATEPTAPSVPAATQ